MILPLQVMSSDLTWQKLTEVKTGTIDIHFRSTEPFMMINADGSLEGLEYEMLLGFQRFLKNKHGYTISYNWSDHQSFSEIYNFIRDNSEVGDFGVDIVSYTTERAEEINFSMPYFPDIQVLVSHYSAPLVESMEEFVLEFDDYTAFSARQTTYDIYLNNIKDDQKMSFDIQYLNSSNDIIGQVISTPESFGYIDLPNYLQSLNNNVQLKRQNILTKKGRGYCTIFNRNSDWHTPFNEYLLSPEYELLKNKSIQKYLGYDAHQLISSVADDKSEEIVLLQKEKNSINRELFQKEKQVQTDTYVKNILILGLIVVVVVAYFFFTSNRSKSKANEILMRHRQMIEDQNTLLSKHNEKLVLKDEEKNNFIHILSHDLRSPINNITGLANILKMEKEDLNEEQLRIISHIGSESLRLNKMVTRMLDVEKIESKTPEQFIKINLDDIIERVLKNYETQAGNKQISFDTDIEKNVTILGDEQYLFHVFENLVSNGIKFSPPDRMLYISVKTLDHLAEVSIKDEGPGMTAEDQQNMFKKFQVLSAKATAGERSTGLGLSIVDKYIGLLGGELICYSEPGKGATFTVKLSLA
ncbi:MAG: ATP-binding protein [Reichenbachiella sp.]